MSSIYVTGSFALNIDDIRMVLDNDPRDKATSIRIDRMVADAIHRHKYIDATKDSAGIKCLVVFKDNSMCGLSNRMEKVLESAIKTNGSSRKSSSKSPKTTK